MRLMKPSWVTHDGKPIFSIDIHPDSSRFATGGQGDDCSTGRVVIWNMAPVRDEKFEKDENVPKILCQMDNHLACVNCVRWSNNGRHLASGGDDKIIMIWQVSRSNGPSSVFGSSGKVVNVEQWRCVSNLRGHSEDVLDVAWSPHDAWLASCSVDNTIIVWNALKFPEQIAVLRGHSGLVKGVTWDPVGKYLASQSDDKSLRVWRTLDWQQEASVTKPFQECGGTTHVLRLNWSPDGHYIVSAHAMNNSGPTAQIVERQGWKSNMDFVGHRKAITVVRFNPCILKKKIKGEKPEQYSCCAIGSRDRSLSIWLTALKRPLVVTHDLFKNTVMDISWTSCGMSLICCSSDGSVAYMDFTKEEIGIPLLKSDLQKLHQKIYGKSLLSVNGQQSNPTNCIVESAAVLNVRQTEQEKQQERTNTTTPQKTLIIQPGTPCKPTDKQIETKTADGRRRITPIFLAPNPDLNSSDTPLPFTCEASQSLPIPSVATGSGAATPGTTVTKGTVGGIAFTTSTGQSKIVVEKHNCVTGPGLTPPRLSDSSSPAKLMPITSSPSTAQKSMTDRPSTPNSSVQGGTSVENRPVNKLKVSSALDKDKPKDQQLIDNELDKRISDLKVKRKLEAGAAVGGNKRSRKDKEMAVRSIAVYQSPPHIGSPSAIVSDRDGISHVVYAGSEVLLSVPRIEDTLSYQVPDSIHGRTEEVIEIENAIAVGNVSLHRARCMASETMLWEHVFPARINVLAASSHLTCIACEDHTLTFLSSRGRRLRPALVLGSTVSILVSSGLYLMAITQKADIFIWRTCPLEVVLRGESLKPILTGAHTAVKKASLTDEGLPVITVSSGKSYTLDQELGCWVFLSNQHDPIRRCSDQSSSVSNAGGKHAGPLAALCKTSHKAGGHASSLYRSNPKLHQAATISHLENRLAASQTLKSSAEYKDWLLAYTRYLAQQGEEGRLREICDDLLGPIHQSRKSSWQAHILSLDKREMLREVLPCIVSNLQLQRLYTEYQEQLDLLNT